MPESRVPEHAPQPEQDVFLRRARAENGWASDRDAQNAGKEFATRDRVHECTSLPG